MRLMRCPFCGYCCETGRMVGLLYCGPHLLSDGSYSPACYMREVLLVEESIEGEGRYGCVNEY